MRVLVAYEYAYRFYREKVVARLKQYDFEVIWPNLPEEQLQKVREGGAYEHGEYSQGGRALVGALALSAYSLRGNTLLEEAGPGDLL
jgi:hypothetical protein